MTQMMELLDGEFKIIIVLKAQMEKKLTTS